VLKQRSGRSLRRAVVSRVAQPLEAQVAARLDRAISAKRWKDPIVRQVIRQFHRIYYGASRRTWGNTYWRGVPILKCPLDLWVYQEILVEVRPDVVVEAGTKHGGSAFYLASILDLLGHGRVLTIDVKPLPGRPEHPRITYLTGSSTDPDMVAAVDEQIGDGERVLVILDSDHSRDHVLAELEAWHSRVSVGSYLIVEDTNLNGHPVARRRGPGPWEAVAEWLPGQPGFRRDTTREKFFLTFNPRGYLKRVA
jgi:cephalosporin hydroxylase